MFAIITSTGSKAVWKLGEEKPLLAPGVTVEKFRASETAYTHIVTHMRGIPKMLYVNTCVWQQPFAQFIFDNIPVGNIEGQPYQSDQIYNPKP